MLTDERWAVLEPLMEACRPPAKVPPSNLRRTIRAILWRHQNGAKWRAIPAGFGPWWMAAQTVIRWSRLGVWERMLAMAQAGGVKLGMAFLDGFDPREPDCLAVVFCGIRYYEVRRLDGGHLAAHHLRDGAYAAISAHVERIGHLPAWYSAETEAAVRVAAAEVLAGVPTLAVAA